MRNETVALNLNNLPGLTRALVEALDTLFPERCPDIQDNERGIWVYAGKRELVRHLKTVLERQERRVDENTKSNIPLGGRSQADRLAGL